MNREEARKILAEREVELRSKFGVKKMALFDAYITGIPTMEGDIDVMAEYEYGVGLFHIFEVQDYIEDVLGEKINMTPRNSVTPRPQDMILGEPVYVFR